MTVKELLTITVKPQIVRISDGIEPLAFGSAASILADNNAPLDRQVKQIWISELAMMITVKGDGKRWL